MMSTYEIIAWGRANVTVLNVLLNNVHKEITDIMNKATPNGVLLLNVKQKYDMEAALLNYNKLITTCNKTFLYNYYIFVSVFLFY